MIPRLVAKFQAMCTCVDELVAKESESEDDYEDDFEDFEDLNDDKEAEVEQKRRSVGGTIQSTELPTTISDDSIGAAEALSVPFPPVGREIQDRTQSNDDPESHSNNRLRQTDFGVDIVHKKRRQVKLASLISLEESKRSVFTQHSLQPWEFYIKRLGSGRSLRQAFSQTNENARSMATQTDKAPTYERGSNAPVTLTVTEFETQEVHCLHSLQKLCETVRQLISEESRQSRAVPLLGELKGIAEAKSDDSPVFTSENKLPNTCEGDVLCCSLEWVDSIAPEVLVAYKNGFESTLVLWDMNDCSRPAETLDCSAVISRCLLTLLPVRTVVASTEEGNMFVWDLSRPEKDSSLFFSTPLFAETETNCSGKLLDLQRVASTTDVMPQVATLFEFGCVIIWSLSQGKLSTVSQKVDALDSTSIVVSHAPRLRLIPIASINLTTKYGGKHIGGYLQEQGEWSCLRFWPNDPNRFSVCCGKSGVLCRSRNLLNSPRKRLLACETNGVSCTCTCMAINPCLPQYVLVGYTDGSLQLFSTDSCVRVKAWHGATTSTDELRNASVIGLQWSTMRATVFFVQDSLENFFLWDLTRSIQVG